MGGTRNGTPATAGSLAGGALAEPAGRPERVFLTGMMGSGKSAVGEQLGALLHWPALDNDELLAEREGLDLLGLAAEGRERLHEAEAALARHLAARPGPFVAGIPASLADREEESGLLARSGLVVYLRTSPARLAERIARSGRRPWVGEDPETWLAASLARRGPAFVRHAHLVLDTDRASPAELAEQIAAALAAPDRTR